MRHLTNLVFSVSPLDCEMPRKPATNFDSQIHRSTSLVRPRRFVSVCPSTKFKRNPRPMRMYKLLQSCSR
ncbi:hypothetical protein MPTK1_5g12780 [Marchantia polymorpha subsp. ruderalis]|uniref:Uncharacterized protein n=2 Tax=Marchantia polymorpha TaxID=3197 RepID=A0AAF6BHQ6_MARPO|nr:hypothetical protein MARPO_0092s0029 [Marchantia polymorpha]BBN11540.1 hypothetical protein Mp_5g12780 [Marchantia polymorpha subsp. ruderalis]|eukprot:PTQ33060.1 hypothetical protein MARPO_0092s0029 [Marchantia polymorpha]